MSNTLAEIIASSQQQNSLLDTVIGTIKSGYQALAGNAQDSAALETKAGVDAAEVVRQRGQGQLDAQEATRTAATSFGTNPDDPGYAVVDLGNVMRDSFDKGSELLKTIQQKQSTGFLDDPLQFIKNQLTVGTDIQKYNQLAVTHDRAKERLTEINALTQQEAATQASIAKTQTAGTVAAASDAILTDAQIKANAARAQAIQFNVRGTEEVAQYSAQQLGNKVNAFQLEEQAKSRQLQQESLRLSAEDRADRLEAKKTSADEDQFLVDYVKTGLATLGNGKIVDLPSAKILQLIKLKDPTYMSALAVGMRQAATGESIISPSPGEAAAILTSTKQNLGPTQTTLKAVLDQGYGDARAGKIGGVLNPTLDTKDQVQVANAATQNIVAITTSMARHIKPNDFSNIYQAPDMKSIAALKGIQGNPLYEKVLKSQIEAGLNNTDPNQILNLALKASNAGTITFNQAVQGTTLWMNAAVKLNNALKNYKKVGIPEQTSYPSQAGPNAGGSTRDFTDITQVTSYAASLIASDELVPKDFNTLLGGKNERN